MPLAFLIKAVLGLICTLGGVIIAILDLRGVVVNLMPFAIILIFIAFLFNLDCTIKCIQLIKEKDYSDKW